MVACAPRTHWCRCTPWRGCGATLTLLAQHGSRQRAWSSTLQTSLSSCWTPALLVSLPHLEANDDRMRSLLANTNVALRPHAKAHKSSAICKWQEKRAEAAGAPVAGFCAQTLNEATALLEAGCTARGSASRGASCMLAASCDSRPVSFCFPSFLRRDLPRTRGIRLAVGGLLRLSIISFVKNLNFLNIR